ncbi:MAG TPA: hypothetical protein VF278_14645 [Pirellulales bacterium]
MSAHTECQLHENHRQRTGERALWHDDVRIWQAEIDALRVKLKQIDLELERQKHDLQVHAAALTLYEQRDAQREHAWIQSERICDDEKRMALDHADEGETSQHGLQRRRHEDLKAGQRRLLSHLRSLARFTELGSRAISAEHAQR